MLADTASAGTARDTATAAGTMGVAAHREAPAVALGPEQFLVLVTCRDERQQVELLGRFRSEGLDCKALLS